MKPTNTLLPLLAALLIGCASTGGKQATSERSGSRPLWVDNHPASPTYFIGVGSARTDGDPVAVQENARMAALNDIAQQIEVMIASDVKLNEHNVTINNTVALDQSIFRKNIRTSAQAVLQDWEVQATWSDPGGRVYCKVVLEKKKYYDRVNKKVNDAIALAGDALAASEQGPFTARLRELNKGISALDEFLGNAMRATIGGKEIILNSELPRRLQALLSSVEIRPNVSQVKLTATTAIPDSLGVRVFVGGQPDSSVEAAWSASVQSVQPGGMPVRKDGLHIVMLNAVPASAGVVTITATVNLGTLAYDLLQRKFALPSGSFTISRQIPRIFLSATNAFSKRLLDRLTTRSAAMLAPSPEEADLILSAQCEPSGEPAQAMGIFRAKALLTVLLTAGNGKRILDISEEYSAADAQSGARAQANAEKVALDAAVKRVEGAF